MPQNDFTHRPAGRPQRRISVLRDDVVKKIAAGEIIERPFSIVRELLDNSLDAESSEITLVIERGGLDRVRVIDNGFGMDRDDLSLCYLAHSTSKILNEDDLLRVRSLGFRGEALSSIGMCARMEITSRRETAPHAHRLIISGGETQSLQPSEGNTGTIVDVTELFSSMPVRKRFLRSASAETAMCRSVFVDRAIAFPHIGFRLITDDRVRDNLPAQNMVERIVSAYDRQLKGAPLGKTGTDEDGIRLQIVLGDPYLHRKDRKLMQLFINGRRVQDYSLQQAAEYAYSGYLPGGLYPVVFVFLDIDPALVDFNVHPTKREVRISNLAQIHRMITGCIMSFLASFDLNRSSQRPRQIISGDDKTVDSERLPGLEADVGAPPDATESSQSSIPEVWTTGVPQSAQVLPPNRQGGEIKYLGQIFGVFLLVEWKESFYIIDQHAAHEKILYERFRSSPKEIQDLLFPISFDTSPQEKTALLRNSSKLLEIGIKIEQVGERTFEILSLSTELLPIGEGELIEVIKDTEKPLEQIEDEVLKLAACRAAVKEGDTLDQAAAGELIRGAFGLQNARCPHGRPIWHHLSREELYRIVGRI
jgi:DNA mismatch repair protein MutL